MSKLSLAEIWRDHHATLIDHRTGVSRPKDFLLVYLPGVIASVGLAAADVMDSDRVAFSSQAVDGMLTASGLLAAFFFGLSVTLLDKAMDFDLQHPTPTPEVLNRATRMQEVAANTAFAAVVAGATTAMLVLSATVKSLSDIAAAFAVGGVVTILTTGAMVLRRIYNETKERLRNVRTGVSAEDQ
jgi:hypothetical protein